MNSKNIILLVVSLLCAYFIYVTLIKKPDDGNGPLDQEKAHCEIITGWLKKKNVSNAAIYGNNDTLGGSLEKVGIKFQNEVVVHFEKKMDDFFNQVNSTNSKSIIFHDDLRTSDSIEELIAYLKSGGIVYFRNFSLELIDNEKLFGAVFDAMKKGQVCVTTSKTMEGNTQSLSIRDKILAENHFYDDSNWAEFEKWHSDAVKRKAEFLQPQPPQPTNE